MIVLRIRDNAISRRFLLCLRCKLRQINQNNYLERIYDVLDRPYTWKWYHACVRRWLIRRHPLQITMKEYPTTLSYIIIPDPIRESILQTDYFCMNILLYLTFRDSINHLFVLHLQLVAISKYFLLYPIGPRIVQFLFLFFAQKISLYLCSYLFTTIPYTECPWNAAKLGVWC